MGDCMEKIYIDIKVKILIDDYLTYMFIMANNIIGVFSEGEIRIKYE